MRPHGKAKLGFFPLPLAEAERLRHCLTFASEFSALDPCVGDGVAFTHLVGGTQARRYGIEIDADRAEQAARLGIDTLQANTSNVRCPADALSLLYLNPPYDFETGQTNNQRLELVFLEHTYRWLKPGGVLVFVIPQPQLRPCARLLSEHFADLFVYKLTEPASVQYKQVAVLGVRRKRHQHLRDSALLDSVRWLEMLASKADLETLGDAPAVRYEIPVSGLGSASPMWEFPSMKWRICCQSRPHTARPAVCFSPNNGTSEAGRSHLCMADTSACSVLPECSMEYSAKENIVTSLTGAR